jgi:cell division protein FtsL
MKLSRSKIITRIIVFSLVIYACLSLIALRGRIDDVNIELGGVRRAVAEMEVSNAQLEYEIENYNDPDVIADIARSELGLVLPGEIVFYDGGSEPTVTD